MSIPKYDEIRISALNILSDGRTMKLKDFIEPISKEFSLTEDEINEMYPSGNGHIFYDRISWALSYLNMAGLLDKPARGIFRISTKGIEMLQKPEKINEYVDNEVAKRDKTKKINKNPEITLVETNDRFTPQENSIHLLAIFEIRFMMRF